MGESRTVVVVGAGGHARVIVDALPEHELAGYIAPEPSAPALGRRLGGDDDVGALAELGHEFAIGVGFVDRPSAVGRSELLARLDGCVLAAVIHPAATVSPAATIEAGVFVAAGAVVGPGVRLGRASIVNTGAIIDHDCEVGENVHIAPGAVCSGQVLIGRDTLVGVGATVRQGVSIGERAVVGAGAVVVSDVGDGETSIGVPARPAMP